VLVTDIYISGIPKSCRNRSSHISLYNHSNTYLAENNLSLNTLKKKNIKISSYEN